MSIILLDITADMPIILLDITADKSIILYYTKTIRDTL